jgi:hypothetical protein
MTAKRRTSASAQVQAFRELAAKISGPEGEARFEAALRLVLQPKAPSKRRRKTRDTVDNGLGQFPGIDAKAN